MPGYWHFATILNPQQLRSFHPKSISVVAGIVLSFNKTCYAVYQQGGFNELHGRIRIKPRYVGPEGLPAPVLRAQIRRRPCGNPIQLAIAPFRLYRITHHTQLAIHEQINGINHFSCPRIQIHSFGIYIKSISPYTFHQVRLRQIEVYSYFKKAHTLLPPGPYSDADIIVLISEAGMLWSYGKYGSRNGG